MSLSYTIRGKVQHGAKRGRTLGFPTANIAVEAQAAPPTLGVYACWVQVGTGNNNKGKRYKGVVNIGVRPTFAENALVVEAHIFDFAGDIYGVEIEVELVEYIRQECAFSTVETLKDQIHLDIMAAKELLNNNKT